LTEQPLLTRSLPPAAAPRAPRVEYVQFQDLPEHREYRFRVYGTEGSSEIRMRIAHEAFSARTVRRQDGAEVCYQKLLRTVAAAEAPYPDEILIEESDLFSYRHDHTPVPKRRSPPPTPPAAPEVAPSRPTPYRSRPARVTAPRLPVAPVVPEEVGSSFEEGQRVNHAIFGAGVTTTSTRERTVVAFDHDGPRTFVTALLDLEVLSPPHTWETGPRGTNRPCKAPQS
jgi:hypothetical protein